MVKSKRGHPALTSGLHDQAPAHHRGNMGGGEQVCSPSNSQTHTRARGEAE